MPVDSPDGTGGLINILCYKSNNFAGDFVSHLRVEIEHAAEREMVTKLEDFLRRRSKISLVVRQEDILSAPGLKEACEILFGDEADAKLQEYVDAVS